MPAQERKCAGITHTGNETFFLLRNAQIAHQLAADSCPVGGPTLQWRTTLVVVHTPTCQVLANQWPCTRAYLRVFSNWRRQRNCHTVSLYCGKQILAVAHQGISLPLPPDFSVIIFFTSLRTVFRRFLLIPLEAFYTEILQGFSLRKIDRYVFRCAVVVVSKP